MIRPAVSLAAVCVLCLFAAACGGDSGGSPSSPSPQPPAQSSESAPASSAAVSPLAGEDAPPQDNTDPAASAADGQATDAQAQTENYYGQPAPETRERDDPQAAWKARRDATDAPAG